MNKVLLICLTSLLLAGCAGVDMSRVGEEMGLDPKMASALGYANRAAVAAMPISDKEEHILGRAVAGQVIARYGIEKDAERTYYLNLVGAAVARHSDRPDLPYRFAILATDDINAYACPGGYIFVTRGAMNMVNDEAELGAVVAHEISHVTERHIIKELQKSRILAVGVDAVKDAFNTQGTLFDQMTKFATDALFNGLKREDEYASDAKATVYLNKTGYDYPAMMDVLSLLKSRTRQARVLSRTHPTPDSRMQQLGSTTPSLGLNRATGIRDKSRFDHYNRS